ncbi:hypothetical protein A8W25_16645 [Streptomyces sp. ERV7]|uniref:hypothetical protein n=1 Tax=Streptomyces sp. ERV7 TaxID=1322334 RepID=UPI0007F49949|nr:hypothetical protein [Streptomyces sp. ERV7]OAR24089.1 hypothetical protein A8W25_16645 [Streptomyces sp. ERV7]
MRKTLLAAATATAVGCLALTACQNDSGAESPSGRAPTTQAPTTQPPAAPSADGPGGGVGSDPSTGTVAQALGEPSRTVGANTVGILEITPMTVVYLKEAGGQTSRYGTFAVVTMDEKSLTANPAAETALAKGGGWHWIAPNGTLIAEGAGHAAEVALGTYQHSGAIEPGAHQLRAKVFDLTPAQARGGKLIYTDGTDSSDRWSIPAQDTGPQVADVRAQLNH